MTAPVRQRDRQAILTALRAGVVPKRGLEHLQVGRANEVEALARDIKHLQDEGCAARVVQGSYGSGKTFFLQVIRQAAQRGNCVTMHADLSQTARLSGTGGKVRSLYGSLISSTSTKSQPEGGALLEVLEHLVSVCRDDMGAGKGDPIGAARRRLASLHQYQGGYDFASVVVAYVRGVTEERPHLSEYALQWIRAEFRTKSEARSALGVGSIITDSDFFSSLRLLALVTRAAGYKGLLVELDELSILERLSRPVREQNYQRIFDMINQLCSGWAESLTIVFSGTPSFVGDRYRGLSSYEPLRRRLAPSEFARPGLRDHAGPVIELEPLTQDDLYLLLENVHRVYCSNAQRDPLSGDETALAAFLQHVGNQLGGLEGVSPSDVVRGWLHLLDMLDQHRRQSWRDLLADVPVSSDQGGTIEDIADDFALFAGPAGGNEEAAAVAVA